MTDTYTPILESIYLEAEERLRKNGNAPVKPTGVPTEIVSHIDLVTDNVEDVRGINNVLVTSFLEKIAHPDQDIRLHQAKMANGYSGRGLDTQYVAPFLKSHHLKSMVESGWLTRSLEQDSPYTLEYRGAIRNRGIKTAFLEILDRIQNGKAEPRACLLYYFQKLILFREKEKVEIRPREGGSEPFIQEICHMLEEHFSRSSAYGKSKLPVIAVYSIYECLMDELKRFEGKKLLPLGHHTSADSRSEAIGDIQVNGENDEPFEGVEIKYGKPITHVLVEDAYEKIRKHPVSRYYILSTEEISAEELPKIRESIQAVATEHGCQVITNGLINSIKYYLRLIENPRKFLERYTANVLSDSELKIEHKEIWKGIMHG